MTPPTQPQIARLYTLAGAAGLDHAGVHAEIHDRYGIDSTKDLDARQYEQFSRDLGIRARSRKSASEHTLADAAMHYPRVYDKAGVEAVFTREYPSFVSTHSSLAADLIEVLDNCRLCRDSGTISPAILRRQLQRWKKVPTAALAAAATIYLDRYTSRDENYFFSIVCRLRRDAKRDQVAAERHARVDQRKGAAIEHRDGAIALNLPEEPKCQSHGSKPTVVCLCGSTRFMQAFVDAGWAETLAGKIVLSIGVCKHAADHGGEALGPEVVALLDELHLRKIDIADEILILNVGGYIGESTGRELAYARAQNKDIRFLEETPCLSRESQREDTAADMEPAAPPTPCESR